MKIPMFISAFFFSIFSFQTICAQNIDTLHVQKAEQDIQRYFGDRLSNVNHLFYGTYGAGEDRVIICQYKKSYMIYGLDDDKGIVDTLKIRKRKERRLLDKAFSIEQRLDKNFVYSSRKSTYIYFFLKKGGKKYYEFDLPSRFVTASFETFPIDDDLHYFLIRKVFKYLY